jgi:hypothetical protein
MFNIPLIQLTRKILLVTFKIVLSSNIVGKSAVIAQFGQATEIPILLCQPESILALIEYSYQSYALAPIN